MLDEKSRKLLVSENYFSDKPGGHLCHPTFVKGGYVGSVLKKKQKDSKMKVAKISEYEVKQVAKKLIVGTINKISRDCWKYRETGYESTTYKTRWEFEMAKNSRKNDWITNVFSAYRIMSRRHFGVGIGIGEKMEKSEIVDFLDTKCGIALWNIRKLICAVWKENEQEIEELIQSKMYCLN